MAANYDLTVIHGPPSPAVPDLLKQRLHEGYVHVYPSQLYTENPGFGVRDIANHVIGLLRQHKSVAVEDSWARGGVRDCLVKVIPNKVPACKMRIIEVRPRHGREQSLWERQFILAACPSPHLVLSDEHIHRWFDEQGPENTSKCSPTDASLKETVAVPLTAQTNYKFEVPALLVQWECVVDSGGYLESKMTAVCQQWAQCNPCGRVVALCDGTAVARGHLSAVQQKSQIVSCMKALASELSCPVYVAQVRSTLDAGEFSVPPSPGLLAFLQRRHCLHLHHRSTVYVYSDIRHMKMAEKAGVRHIQVKKVLKSPQVLKTCHSATASPVPLMLQQLQLVADSSTTDMSALPSIPLVDLLPASADQYVCVDHPRGLREFLFAQDVRHLQRFQTRYADSATPIGEVGSHMEKTERLEKTQPRRAVSDSDDQATLREHVSEIIPREIPSWMLRKRGSSTESEPIPATLEKSCSTNSVEGRGRSRHTVYIMTEKELLETAKDVLKQAGREDLIDTCILQCSKGGTTNAVKKDAGNGNVAPVSCVNDSTEDTKNRDIDSPTPFATVMENTEIIGPTPAAAAGDLRQHGTSTRREDAVKEITGPPAVSVEEEDSASTAPKKPRLSPSPAEGEGKRTDAEQSVSSRKSSQPENCPSKQQRTDKRTETHRKAPDLSILDEIFF